MCEEKKCTKWRRNSNISAKMWERSANASKRESKDLETRTNILRFRGNETNKRRRFLSSMRMQIRHRSRITKRNEFFFLSFFSHSPLSVFYLFFSHVQHLERKGNNDEENKSTYRTLYQNFVPVNYLFYTSIIFPQVIYSNILQSYFGVKLCLKILFQARINADCVGGISNRRLYRWK